MDQEPEDIFEIAKRIHQVDFEARTRGSIGGEDAIWLTERVRKLEKMLYDSRQKQRLLERQKEDFEHQIDDIRRTYGEWEDRLWKMNDFYRTALDQSESELEELNSTVQEVLKHQILVEPQIAKSPNPDVRRTQESEVMLSNHSSAAIVCRQGLAQLSEMSVSIAERQNSETLEEEVLEFEPPTQEVHPNLKRTYHMNYFFDSDLDEVPSLDELDFLHKSPTKTNPAQPEPIIGGQGIIRVQRHKR